MPQFINNTISENGMSGSYTSYGGGIFVDWGTCQGYNNIVYGNSAGNGPDCYGSVSFTYSCSGASLSGTGNIMDDPLFVSPVSGNFQLQAGSPCIDAGDPTSPLDPDNTIADMGAFYYDQSGSSPVVVTLMPYNPPIQVPASGGSFDFNIEVANNGTNPETFDIWTMTTLPNGSEYGPIINVPDFTAPASWSANRDRTQAVPGSAPAGIYTYDAYVGVYPDNIWNEDHFDFEKLAGDGGVSQVGGWECWGELFENADATVGNVANSYVLFSAYPNPFNPMTTLSFSIAEAGTVSLKVYDVTGREVVVLVNGYRNAGVHEVTFDASHLASGIYVYQMQIGDFSTTGKMVLMK
jgi:hypothetical protein